MFKVSFLQATIEPINMKGHTTEFGSQTILITVAIELLT